MLSPEHCQRRAERLRMVLICTAEPSAGARLRNIIGRYRALAKSAYQPTSGPVAQFKSDLDRMVEKAHHHAVDPSVLADLLEGSARALRVMVAKDRRPSPPRFVAEMARRESLSAPESSASSRARTCHYLAVGAGSPNLIAASKSRSAGPAVLFDVKGQKPDRHGTSAE